MLLLLSAFRGDMSSAIRWQRHQLSAITAAPSSLDYGQLLTICDIVWHLSQGHMLVAARPHFFRQDVQWPWLIRKQFRNAQYRQIESWLPDSGVIH